MREVSREKETLSTNPAYNPIMAGLVPAIHDLTASRCVWMAATRAAMTNY
jgi:hypothetical protein